MLIDMKKYLPFEIDDEMFKKLCFAETVLISYVASREVDTTLNNQKAEEGEEISEQSEQNVCNCDVCRCKILPKPGSRQTDIRFMEDTPLNSAKVRYDLFEDGSDDDETVRSEHSIEFNDDFFQVGFQEPSKNTLQHVTQSGIKILSTPFIDLNEAVSTGAKTISVKGTGLNKNQFSVYVSSRFYLDGYEIGLSYTSTVDSRLHTLAETSTEHMKKSDRDFCEREKSIVLGTDGYKCDFSHRQQYDKTITSKKYTFEEMEEALLDGAFIVLVRYIALTRFQGEFQFKSLNISGEICDCELVSKLGIECINKVKVPVMKIYSNRTSPSGQKKLKGFILSMTGVLLQVHAANSKYVMHIIPDIDEATKNPIPMSPSRNLWKDNALKFFNYITDNCKEHEDTKNNTTDVEKAQLQAMLSEYFEVILKMKPLDVIPFTSNYFFGIFSDDDFPHNPHFDKTFRRVRYFE